MIDGVFRDLNLHLARGHICYALRFRHDRSIRRPLCALRACFSHAAHDFASTSQRCFFLFPQFLLCICLQTIDSKIRMNIFGIDRYQ